MKKCVLLNSILFILVRYLNNNFEYVTHIRVVIDAWRYEHKSIEYTTIILNSTLGYEKKLLLTPNHINYMRYLYGTISFVVC